MRYINVDNIEFTNIDNKTFVVKDMREIPIYNTLVNLKIDENAMLDEIATRQEVYGEAREDLSYAIFEHNMTAITENNFSLEKFKKIKVPVAS